MRTQISSTPIGPSTTLDHRGTRPDPSKEASGATRHIPHAPSTHSARPGVLEQAAKPCARPPTQRRTCPRCRLAHVVLGSDHGPTGCTLNGGWRTHQAT